MSEAMTTVEIEDVLSSIRRLVSEDLRPTHKLVSAALQKGATKLILTPALRIVSDVRSALPEPDGDDQQDLKAVLLEIDGDEGDAFGQVLPVFGSVRLPDATTQSVLVLGAEPESVAFDADFLTTAMSRINGLGRIDGDAPNHSDGIEAVVAAVGAAVGAAEWEVDGGDPAPQAQAQAWADATWHSDAEVREADAGVGASDVVADDLEAASADLDEAADHDRQSDTLLLQADPGRDPLGGPDSIIFHDASVAAQQVFAQDTGDAEDDFDDGAGFVSEDILREIVRDMIREELQGSLGERITRNVRKLVRAEINRALASHNHQDIANRG